jgi:hypothetical protein
MGIPYNFGLFLKRLPMLVNTDHRLAYFSAFFLASSAAFFLVSSSSNVLSYFSFFSSSPRTWYALLIV